MTAPTRIRPSVGEVLDLVRAAIAVVCEQPQVQISPESALADLGADSLARVEVAEIVEERLAAAGRPRLHIADAELAEFGTVSDIVDYLVARL